MKNNYRNNIGSVSHGTMREEDLIPAFLEVLKGMKPLRRKHRIIISQIEKSMYECHCDPPCKTKQEKRDNEAEHLSQYFDSEEAEYDLNEDLFDALQDYCLPYFYFGNHPGDGSDYGFWLCEDWEEAFCPVVINERSNDSYITIYDEKGYSKTTKGGWESVPKGYTGEIMHINDHGNMTLYKSVRGRKYEIWSVV